jgi:hypothetical protein
MARPCPGPCRLPSGEGAPVTSARAGALPCSCTSASTGTCTCASTSAHAHATAHAGTDVSVSSIWLGGRVAGKSWDGCTCGRVVGEAPTGRCKAPTTPHKHGVFRGGGVCMHDVHRVLARAAVWPSGVARLYGPVIHTRMGIQDGQGIGGGGGKRPFTRHTNQCSHNNHPNGEHSPHTRAHAGTHTGTTQCTRAPLTSECRMKEALRVEWQLNTSRRTSFTRVKFWVLTATRVRTRRVDVSHAIWTPRGSEPAAVQM